MKKGKRIFHSVVAGVLLMALVICLMPMMPMEVEAAIAFTDGNKPEVKLYIKNGSDLTEVEEGTPVSIESLSQGFEIRYSWDGFLGTSSNTTTEKQYGLTTTTYNLPSFSNLVLSGSQTEDIYDENDDVYGQINYSNNTVTFSQVNDIYKPTFGFNCKIDENANAENADGKVTISLPAGKKFIIKVKDLEPKGPTIEKTAGTINKGTGEVDWTVTITDPEKYYTKTPVDITDIIPAGMEFVSLNPGPGGVTTTAAEKATGEIKFTLPATTTNSAVWVKTSDPKVTNTFTYRTRLTDAEKANVLNNGGSTQIPYKNAIKLNGTDNGTPVILDKDDATVKIKPSDVPAVSKVGSTYDATNKQVTWTVTVNTLGIPKASLSSFAIQDTLGEYLSFEPGAKANVTGTMPNVEVPITSPGGIYTIDLSSQTPKPDGTLVATYTTKVNDAVFSDEAEVPDGIKNTAKVVMEFNEITIGPVSKETGKIGPSNFSTKMITKKAFDARGNSAGGESSANFNNNVDAGTARLDYQIVLNPNMRPIGSSEEVWLTDILGYRYDKTAPNKLKKETEPADGEWKVSICEDMSVIITAINNSGVTADGSSFVWLDKDLGAHAGNLTSADAGYLAPEDRKGFKVKINGLDGKSATIKLHELVKDPRILLTVHGHEYGPYNAATLQVGSDIFGDNALYGFKNAADNLFKKSSKAYDASTKTMTWKFEISKWRQTSFGTFTVVDTLDPRMTYVTSSGAFTNALGKASVKSENYDVDNHTVTWELETTSNFTKNLGDGGFEFEYQTKLNLPADNYLVDDLKLENTATLKPDPTYGIANLTSKATATIEGKKILGKNGIRQSNKNIIDYTVDVNPYQVTIPKKSGVTRLSITDKLGSGVVLDPSSVKLYKATMTNVTVDGKYSVKLNPSTIPSEIISIDFSDETSGHKYDFPNNSFTVALPDDAVTSNQPYVLKYTAIAQSPGDLINEVTIDGSSVPSTSAGNTAKVSFSAAAYSSATKYVPSAGSPFYELKVIKKDKDTNAVVSTTGSNKGATFELFVGTNTRVATAVSVGSDGVAQFLVPQAYLNSLSSTSMLYIQEIEPPTGYQISHEIKSIKKSDLTGTTHSIDFFDSRTEEIPADPNGPVLNPPAPPIPPYGGGDDTPPNPPAPPVVPQKPVAPIELKFDINTNAFVTDMVATPLTQTMNAGDVPTIPNDLDIDPWSLTPGDVVGDYVFEGWYADPEFKIPFDFAQALTEDTIVYAKWSAVRGFIGTQISPRTGYDYRIDSVRLYLIATILAMMFGNIVALFAVYRKK